MMAFSRTIKILGAVLLLLFVFVHLGGQLTGLSEGGRAAYLLAYDFSQTWGLHQYWRILTAPWIHSDAFSLLINILVIGFLGGELERIWGARKFLLYYGVCAYGPLFFFILADMLFMKGAAGSFLGATSATYGILMAYGILFAERQMLFMMVIPMKAKHFIWILVGVDLLTAISGGRSLTLTCAHLSGLGFGLLTLLGMAKWKEIARRREVFGGETKNKQGARGGGHLRLVSAKGPVSSADKSEKIPGDKKESEDKSSDKSNKSRKKEGSTDDDSGSSDPRTWH